MSRPRPTQHGALRKAFQNPKSCAVSSRIFCVGEAISKRSSCNLVQLRHQLDPSAFNARRVRVVISLLDEYGFGAQVVWRLHLTLFAEWLLRSTCRSKERT
jgi:hypothetical protein